MRYVNPGEDWQTWRSIARELLQSKTAPSEVKWIRSCDSYLDFGDEVKSSSNPLAPNPLNHEAILKPENELRVPKAFLELSKSVSYYNDPTRWDLLYRMLWRLTHNSEPHLLDVKCDDDVLAATKMAKAVSREIHKMHAFVRFRRVGEMEDGREYFVAWFEPEHWIIEPGCDLFKRRFANMDWSVYSPRGCAHWIDKQFWMTDPVSQDPTATVDSMEDLWRTYYQSIFNPARLKLKAMQSEMPKKYWRNLPEAELIEHLTQKSQVRVQNMLDTTPRPAKPVTKNKYLKSLYEATDSPDEEGEAGVK